MNDVRDGSEQSGDGDDGTGYMKSLPVHIKGGADEPINQDDEPDEEEK